MAKKKRVPTKAEKEAEASHKKLVDKWSKVPTFSGKYGVLVMKAPTTTLSPSPGVRDTGTKLKSVTTLGGSTAPVPNKVYTGTEMLGVGQLHKSNAVPVFRAEDAVDIAKMRR